MEIRILGAHNCESLKTRLVCLLIDDRLAIDAGGLTSALSTSQQQKLGAVLLTHQHYDHIRDIPILAFNMYQWQRNIKIYCAAEVRDAINSNILNGKHYPEYHKIPAARPTVSFQSLNPCEPESIEGYSVLAVPVNHAVPAVGYQVASSDGRTVFYTGDTGPGLSECWAWVCPDLLLVDVTKPDSQRDFALSTGRLTPGLLHDELVKFQELKGYLPHVVIVHMDPMVEPAIADEVATVARRLNISITHACEGMRLTV